MRFNVQILNIIVLMFDTTVFLIISTYPLILAITKGTCRDVGKDFTAGNMLFKVRKLHIFCGSRT